MPAVPLRERGDRHGQIGFSPAPLISAELQEKSLLGKPLRRKTVKKGGLPHPLTPNPLDVMASLQSENALLPNAVLDYAAIVVDILSARPDIRRGVQENLEATLKEHGTPLVPMAAISREEKDRQILRYAEQERELLGQIGLTSREIEIEVSKRVTRIYNQNLADLEREVPEREGRGSARDQKRWAREHAERSDQRALDTFTPKEGENPYKPGGDMRKRWNWEHGLPEDA
jgi:hypothetical protein